MIHTKARHSSLTSISDGQTRSPNSHAPQPSTPPSQYHYSNRLHRNERQGLSSWTTVTMGSEQEEAGRPKGRVPPPVHDFRRGAPQESGPPSPSFLQAEEDEFERLFTELLYASHTRAAAAAKMADISLIDAEYNAPTREGEDTGKSGQLQERGSGEVRRPTLEQDHRGDELRDSRRQRPLLPDTGTVPQPPPPPPPPPVRATGGIHDHQEGTTTPPHRGEGNQARSLEGRQHRAGGSICLQSDSTDRSGKVCSTGLRHSLSLPAQLDEAEDTGELSTVDSRGISSEEVGQLAEEEEDSIFSMMEGSLPHHHHGIETTKQPPPPLRKAKSFQSGDGPESYSEQCIKRPALGRRSDGALLQGSNRDGRLFDTGDKLFFDLLDDLDNLTGDTPSVRRRQRARDIFSDWLFNEQAKSGSTSSLDDPQGQGQPRNRKSFHEYLTHGEGEDIAGVVGSPDSSDRQSRAGSEPSQRKRSNSGVNTTGDNLHSPPVSQHRDPGHGHGKTKLSLSEQDALLERKLREQYLASRGCISAEELNYFKNEKFPSPRNSPEHMSPSTTPPKKSFPRVSSPQLQQQKSITTSTPPQSPKFSRAVGSRGPRCSANAVDTLEILKNVKFRKKNPKCLLSLKSGGDVVGGDHANGTNGVNQLVPRLSALGTQGGALHPHPQSHHPRHHQPHNIYQRWKLRGRPLSFEYLSEVSCHILINLINVIFSSPFLFTSQIASTRVITSAGIWSPWIAQA